jgi:hypothetical protein
MRIPDQVTARQAETATARDQAIDLADSCNNHRDMLRNCLQWMDQTAMDKAIFDCLAFASMLEVNGWTEADDEPVETSTDYCARLGFDM